MLSAGRTAISKINIVLTLLNKPINVYITVFVISAMKEQVMGLCDYLMRVRKGSAEEMTFALSPADSVGNRQGGEHVSEWWWRYQHV